MVKNILKKIVALTHTISSHFVHLPKKWCEQMKLEKEDQVLLEFDGEKITVRKLK